MTIRQMNIDDAGFAYECTDKEGWQSETKDSFISFLEYDPEGCFIAEVNNERVGLCVAVKYMHSGFIGELIVVEEHRGKGFGMQLFEKAIKYLKSNNIHNIYLDGDLDAVPIYEKYGFRKVCKSLRFNGRNEVKSYDFIRHAGLQDLDKVCEFDRELFGDDRSYFLKRRHSMFPELFHVAEIDNQIAGYITAQPGNGVMAVGPWAIDGTSINAVTLLESIATEIGDNEMRIGVLDSNRHAAELMRSLDSFREETYCWRMVLGESDSLGRNDNLFAIGSGAKG